MAELDISSWHELPYGDTLETAVEWQSPELRPPIEEVEREPISAATIAELNPYRYSPLDTQQDSVRLLRLGRPIIVLDDDGWEQNTLPTGVLMHVPLDGNPVYAALSYHWGCSDATDVILIDDCIMRISRSLHDAIHQLQSYEQHLWLWIDAICINQNDSLEKASQIPLMGRIYREASLVVGWLGPAADGSDIAMKYLRYLGEMAAKLPEGEQRWSSRVELFRSLLPEDTSRPDLIIPAEEIRAVFSRAWWLRIWVVQEAVLASKAYVVCGDVTAHLHDLMMAFAFLHSFDQVNAYSGGKLNQHARKLTPALSCGPRLIEAVGKAGRQSSFRLHQALHNTTGFQASMKQDHIYGLFGMVSDLDSLSIDVNYSRPVAATYTQVAKALITKQKQLVILARCQLPKSVDGLPSWVPDWSQIPNLRLWRAEFRLYDAGGPSILQSIECSNDLLTVSGYEFDVIHRAGPSWSHEQLSVEPPYEMLRDVLRETESFAIQECSAYSSQEKLADAIVRTPIADAEMSSSADRDRTTIRATTSCHSAFQALKCGDRRSVMNMPTQFRSYVTYVTAELLHRRLFVTRKGYLGLGPHGTSEGDLVCVLRGAQVPFVMREQTTPGRVPGTFWKREKISCELVGEAYVHGIMDGEVWTSLQTGKDFVIS